MGACWRMPELAHTQTHLSNTFAEVRGRGRVRAMVSASPCAYLDKV